MLQPELRGAASSVGGGRRVLLTAVDERPRSLIGRRGAGGSIGGAITTDQDLADLIRQKMADGLQRSGFAPSAGDGTDPRMNVEVRALEYELAMGFWSGSVNTRAAVKAICRNGDAAYEKLYRAEDKRGAFFIPTASANTRMLNKTLGDVLDKALADRELLGCLAH
jgi:uncharacterized lipoprotein YajG